MSGTDDLRELLRRRLAEVEREVRARGPQPWHGFWGPGNRAPRGIVTPEELTAGERLTVACTQAGLAPREQRALVARWCDLLPKLDGVRHLWLESRVPQELFDAACAMPALRSLRVKWGGVKSLEALAGASALEALRLGSSPGVTDLGPLARMPRLTWLELENLKRVTDLAPPGRAHAPGRPRVLGGRRAAQQRRLAGAARRAHEPALAPTGRDPRARRVAAPARHARQPALARARQLLFHGSLRRARAGAAGHRLHVVRAVRALRHLGLPLRAVQDERARVMTSGKGSRLLCPQCDAKALAEHVERFDRARAGAGLQ